MHGGTWLVLQITFGRVELEEQGENSTCGHPSIIKHSLLLGITS